MDLPISELDKEADEKLSSSSIDKSTQLNVSMSSIYENFRQLNRFKLANIIDSDPTVNESKYFYLNTTNMKVKAGLLIN